MTVEHLYGGARFVAHLCGHDRPASPGVPVVTVTEQTTYDGLVTHSRPVVEGFSAAALGAPDPDAALAHAGFRRTSDWLPPSEPGAGAWAWVELVELPDGGDAR